jgi:hypothetical protein
LSTHDDRRRGQGAGRQGPNQGEQQPRQRRAPLFPLEADDITPSARRAPPAPLGELLGDLDAMLPSRPLSPRDEAAGPRPQAQRPPTPPERAAHRPAAEPARPQQASPAVARTTIAQAAQPRARQDLRTAPLADLLAEQLPSIDASRVHLEAAEAHLTRLELSEARPRLGSYRPAPAAPSLSLNNWVVLVVVCLASLLVLLTMGGRGGTSFSAWNQLQRAADVGGAANALVASANPGDYELKRPPSISPQQIDRILESYGSPAVGSGQDWYNLGLQYGIDPAFAVAFFIHESSAGSNPNWAGLKPNGGTTHNVGNIICAGYSTCYGRFRDYSSWAEGIEDWYRLIDVEYIQGRGHRTVADIIPVYAPAFENDVQGYVNAVQGLIDQWRTEGLR